MRAHRAAQHEQRLKLGAYWRGDLWGDLIFCDDMGEPLSGRGVTTRFQALLSDSDLPRMRFHDLRHAFATLCLAAKIDIKIVQVMLGHSKSAITSDLYTQVPMPMIRDATDKVAGFFDDEADDEDEAPAEAATGTEG